MTVGPGLSHKADEAFSHLRRRVFFRRIVSYFTGHPAADLLSFEQVRDQLQIRDQHYKGLHEIPIAQIAGSTGRYHEFNRAFLPAQEYIRERWKGIYLAAHEPMGFPPIDVYQIDDVYFVRDGHHRVSVLKELGATTVEANIIQLETAVSLSPDTDEAGLKLKAEYAAFLRATGLDALRPDPHLEFTLSGQYQKLFEHIAVHRHYLGLRLEHEIPYEEAVVSWYHQVYRPMVGVIAEEGVLSAFPGRTEADLYLWIIEHRLFLSERYGQDVPLEQAATEFSKEFSRGPGRKQLEAETKKAKGSTNPIP